MKTGGQVEERREKSKFNARSWEWRVKRNHAKKRKRTGKGRKEALFASVEF